MFVKILDADGNPRLVIMNGPGPATDMSGVILVGDQTQVVAPANPVRSGWFFQNISNNPMLLNDLGDASEGDSVQIGPGESWPPQNYPPSPGAISVAGQEGDKFIYREW